MIPSSELAHVAEVQKRVNGLGVIIATAGRRQVAEATIVSLARRRTVPGHVVIVGACPEDLPSLVTRLPFQLDAVLAEKGSSSQRNGGLRHLPAAIEFVAFLDDDMEVHDEYCEEVARVFQDCAEVAGFSGCLLANGGIDRAA